MRHHIDSWIPHVICLSEIQGLWSSFSPAPPPSPLSLLKLFLSALVERAVLSQTINSPLFNGPALSSEMMDNVDATGHHGGHVQLLSMTYPDSFHFWCPGISLAGIPLAPVNRYMSGQCCGHAAVLVGRSVSSVLWACCCVLVGRSVSSVLCPCQQVSSVLSPC